MQTKVICDICNQHEAHHTTVHGNCFQVGVCDDCVFEHDIDIDWYNGIEED